LANSGVEGYPARLGALLGPGYSVMNAGVSGKTMFKNSVDSYWSTGRLEDAVAFDPHIVIIKLGTNDGDPKRWDVYEDEFYDDYVSMVQEFRRDGRDPVVFAAYCAPLFANATQDYYIKNKVIPNIDQVRESQGLYALDFYNNLLGDNDLFPDGVHPNAEGAAKMAQIAFDAIKSVNAHVTSSIFVNGNLQVGNVVSVDEGDEVTLELDSSGGTYSWHGPNGFTSDSDKHTLGNIQFNQGGFYNVVYTGSDGLRSYHSFVISINDCIPDDINPYIWFDNSWQNVSMATVDAGSEIRFGPQPFGGYWCWNGPDGFLLNSREFSLFNIKNRQAGDYIAVYRDDNACISSMAFNVQVVGEDVCKDNVLSPYLNVNNTTWESTSVAEVAEGGTVTFGPQAEFGYKWTWTGPNGFFSREREFSISGFSSENAGEYIATVTYDEDCTAFLKFNITLIKNPVFLNEIDSSENDKVQLYPNPTTGEFVITNVPRNSRITVFDDSGIEHVCWYSSEDNDKVHLSINNFSAGRYIVHINNELEKSFILVKE